MSERYYGRVKYRWIKARWATAADPDEGRICVSDGKSEGVIPLQPLPKGWNPTMPPMMVEGWLRCEVFDEDF